MKEREKPADAVERVAALPKRIAHAVYALQGIHNDLGTGPWKTNEIIYYDPEALAVSETYSALYRAAERGLVIRWGSGLWSTTPEADDLKEELEDRFLKETE